MSTIGSAGSGGSQVMAAINQLNKVVADAHLQQTEFLTNLVKVTVQQAASDQQQASALAVLDTVV